MVAPERQQPEKKPAIIETRNQIFYTYIIL